jgi:hypothetical protein
MGKPTLMLEPEPRCEGVLLLLPRQQATPLQYGGLEVLHSKLILPCPPMALHSAQPSVTNWSLRVCDALCLQQVGFARVNVATVGQTVRVPEPQLYPITKVALV